MWLSLEITPLPGCHGGTYPQRGVSHPGLCLCQAALKNWRLIVASGPLCRYHATNVNAARICLTALLALTAVALPTVATSARAADAEKTDRVIIQWRQAPTVGESAADETRALGSRTGKQLSLTRPIGGRFELLRLDHPHSPAELRVLLAQLRADPKVALAEPDRRVRAHAYLPNDPLFTGQWYLKSAQISATRAESAWDITRGNTSVVVAVLDTGVRFDHPDLRPVAAGGKLLPGYDFVSGESGTSFATSNDGDGWDPDPSDPGDFISAQDLAEPSPFAGKGCGANGSDTQPVNSSWHGTRVSGLIAADTDNAQGIAGGGFNVRILPVRVLGKCGGFDSDVIAGMYWAAGMSIPAALLSGTPTVNPNPAQVINMSLGGTGPCDAKYTTAVSDITARGVLVVVSAGNEGAAVDSPANCTGALAVTGVRHVGTKVGYSNLGAEAGIAAPAGNCVNIGAGQPCLFTLDTTANTGTTTPAGSTYTDQFNSNVGTSFSAPLASATAALMKSVNPALTPALLTSRMRATARAFPTTNGTATTPPMCQNPSVGVQNEECICTTALCGAGLLDTGAAVVDAQRPTALAQVTGIVGIGRTLTLDGSQSAAATGRTASYLWTVFSTAGGAGTPAISNATLATASALSPSTGSYTLQLTVTDNLGFSDSAQVTVTAVGTGGSTGGTSPPPATSSGGGGALSPLALLLLASLVLALLRRTRTAR